MNTINERRRAARLEVNSSVECYLRMDGGAYRGTLKDMSLTGLYMELNMELKKPVQISGTCEVEIVLNGDNSRLKIECRGSIVRCDENGMAVHFDSRMEWFPIVASYFQRRL